MGTGQQNSFNWWTSFRVFCFVSGLTLVGVAYFAPEWLSDYVSTDLASTVGFVLLLLLPATMVLQLGGSRILRAVRKSGRRAERERARVELAAWTAEHPLSFEPATQPGEVGSVLGRYRDRLVIIDIDAGDLSVRWNHDMGDSHLELSTDDPTGSPEAARAFDTGDERFDEVFETRRAEDWLQELFATSETARSALLELWGAHRGALRAVHLDEEAVVCLLNGEARYDVDVVAAVLDDTVDAVAQLEACFGADSPEEASV